MTDGKLIFYRTDDGRVYWVPGVNNLGKFGRWAFAKFTEVFEIEAKFNKLIDGFVSQEAAG